MKKFERLFVLLFTGCFLLLAGLAKAQVLEAGAAEMKINPPEGSYLAGYQQNRKSTGVHDDLFAKAVVIANAQNSIAIVTIDCIGLPYPLVQKIRDEVEERIPRADFNADHVVVSSTHTHSGPDVIGIWGEDMTQSGTDSAYINQLVSSAAEAIVKAWKGKQRVIARYAVTSFGQGWVENISDSAEVDRDLTVLQFVNSKGKNIASLTNFACHPTFLDKENTLVSADFPSGLYKQLKTKLGGVNLFLQGAIGGWVQPEHVSRSFEDAEKKGRELADMVVLALKQAKPLKGSGIYYASRQFELPVANKLLRDLATARVIKRDISEGTPTEIAWFSVGDAMFATHPGETSPLYSLHTKQMMNTSGPRFILGLGMDELGYIIKPDFFAPGTRLHAAAYLTSMSPGMEAGDIMMNVLEELIEDSK
ncbi:MAG: neutral/alkaline non-lysosomal ceramidase N-terminal domain-containing protein [Chitinophagaceae bacterium]|nr:neutral/alkaline non-lysosomal ceramidase N-terminal domain-containing protein [Chitinophagaceae bacterium]